MKDGKEQKNAGSQQSQSGCCGIKIENQFLIMIQKHARFLKKGTDFYLKKVYVKNFCKKENPSNPLKDRDLSENFMIFRTKS